MDWELKSSPWDFTDDQDPRLAPLLGSNSLNGGDFSVDLKLGRLEDTRDDNVNVQKCPSSSQLGSSKRARVISGAQNLTCLVDGCIADLSGCREYHRRHRVCEQHSKTPVVFICCKEQRFCQQCSRFHSLTEFDDEKRSCRKRLDGHNRRRRKPQPGAFYINQERFLSNHKGTRLLQFGGPETYPTSTVLTWPSTPKHPIPQQSSFPNSSPTIQNGSNSSPTIQNGSNSSPTIQNGSDRCFPFLLINEPERSNHHHPIPQVTTNPPFTHNVNPHRVHSLLSSPSSSSHQPMAPTALQFGYPSHQFPRSPAMVPEAGGYHSSYSGNETTMLSLSPDDLLEKGASQFLPFSWK